MTDREYMENKVRHAFNKGYDIGFKDGKEKAKSQQLCEDAISRQAAIDAMATWDWQELYLPIHFKQLLEDLPSVSTEKTGRWISWYEVIESADCKSEDHIPHCKCSECNCEYDTYSAHFIKYCPNCGAKMEQPYEGESEVQE